MKNSFGEKKSMNFSKLHLSEGESLDAAAAAAEKASTGGQKQKEGTMNAREKQKSQMAAQQNTPVKSDVSYASEEARREREYDKMIANESVDWRKELYEAATPDEQGNHPFVDVMPFLDQKQQEAKKQMKGAVKAGKGMQSSMQQAPDMAEAKEYGRKEYESGTHKGKPYKERPDTRSEMESELAASRDDRISDQEKKVPKSRIAGKTVDNKMNVYYNALDQSGSKEKKAMDKAEKEGKPVKHPSLGDNHKFNKMSGAKMKGPKMKGVIKKMSEDVMNDLKVSREYFKKRNARSPEEKAAQEKKDAQGRAKNAAANRNNNIGQFDHSKRND
jgi:hypothetical protein